MLASSVESPAVSRTRPLAERSHSPAVPVVGAARPSARLICTRKSDSVTPIPWSESPKCPSSPCQGSAGIFFVIVLRESQASRAGLPANLRHCGRLVSPRVIEAARLEADWLEYFRGVSVGTLSSRRLRQTRRDEWETKTLLANSLSTRSLSGSRRRSGAPTKWVRLSGRGRVGNAGAESEAGSADLRRFYGGAAAAVAAEHQFGAQQGGDRVGARAAPGAPPGAGRGAGAGGAGTGRRRIHSLALAARGNVRQHGQPAGRPRRAGWCGDQLRQGLRGARRSLGFRARSLRDGGPEIRGRVRLLAEGRSDQNDPRRPRAIWMPYSCSA